jgi:hypothetical protein
MDRTKAKFVVPTGNAFFTGSAPSQSSNVPSSDSKYPKTNPQANVVKGSLGGGYGVSSQVIDIIICYLLHVMNEVGLSDIPSTHSLTMHYYLIYFTCMDTVYNHINSHTYH